METKINYFLLLITIILGIVIGNLLSHQITLKYFTQEEKHSITEQLEEPSNNLTQPAGSNPSEKLETVTRPQETIKLSPKDNDEVKITTPEIPTNSEELIEQRRLDENGIRLAKQCNEWTVVHKDMQTKTSERGMNKYCDQYYDYISFGTLTD